MELNASPDLSEQIANYTGLLPDFMIDHLVKEKELITHSTYVGAQVKTNAFGDSIPSKGLSSTGYDVTLSGRFAVIKDPAHAPLMPIDVRNFDSEFFVQVDAADKFILPAGTFALGVTNEYFNMPDDVTAVAVGKSTYARAGLQVIVTPIEAGFKGNVVIEMFNMTPHPIVIFPDAGISQFMFYKTPRPSVTYGDRSGKYQGQQGITFPR